MEINPILARIQAYLDDKNWTRYKLSQESGVSKSCINTMFKRNTEPTISTLRCICNGLGISMSDFFADDFTPPSENLSQKEKELLSQYNSIKKRDKELLLSYAYGLNHKERQ